MSLRPLVSVIVEGYNDTLDIGDVDETIAALEAQDYPRDRIEIILVGSDAQAGGWRERYGKLTGFHRIAVVAGGAAHYYELKNRGASEAGGEILAFTDSDVCPSPGWVAGIVSGIQGGAEVTAGVSLYRWKGERASRSLWLDAAASISWGFIAGWNPGEARGFLSHNLGCRADVFRRHTYRSDLGRTCAGTFLFDSLRDAGVRIVFQPEQKVAHAFEPVWWATRLHVRFGHEVWRLRRIHGGAPHRWLRVLSPVEPLLTMLWHVALDVPQWFRYSPLMPVGPVRRLLLVPAVVAMSVVARSAEMFGMYATQVAPERMGRFAAVN